jgi:adenylate cyclase
MAQLQVFLFGSPTLILDGQEVTLERLKSLALLTYLILEKRPIRRDSLATLLWPEQSQSSARAGLRRALFDLRERLGPDWFEVDRERVQIRACAELWVDVWTFQAVLGEMSEEILLREDAPAVRFTDAIALYRDDLLAGFSLRDTPAFEDWRFFAAEDLRQQLIGALKIQVAFYAGRGEVETALSLARRWLASDPLDEEAHRLLMQLYASTGNRVAALRQYNHCITLIQQELGAPPDPATVALHEQIQDRSAAPTPADLPQSPPAGNIQPLAPATSTPIDGAGCDEIRDLVVLSLGMVGPVDSLAPDQARRALSAFLAEARAVSGRMEALVAHLGTDGALLLWGANHTYEDDAQRALRVAFDLQAAARQAGLQIAVAVKIGPAQVIYGEADPSAFGAVIHQAAELQRAAAAGQILVDRATYLQTHAGADFTEAEVTLRGQETQPRLYQLRNLHQAQKTRGIPGRYAPLIAREEELAHLQTALYEILCGRGQIVLVTGEAGIGKSRLCAELRKLAGQHCRWVTGHCLEMTSRTSYWPFQEIVRGCLGAPPGPDDPAAHVTRTLEDLAGEGHLAPQMVAECAALFGCLLNISFGDSRDQRLSNVTPLELHQRMIDSVATFLLALAQRAPLVLEVEDLHWADSGSLDLLNELLDRLADASLLLLAIYRPVAEHDCMQLATWAERKCPGHYRELRLAELTPAQNRQMIHGLLEQEALPPATRQWILERAQGNPYFTEEVILAMIEAGWIVQQDGVWQATPGAPGHADALAASDLLPYGIGNIVRTRAEKLNLQQRRCLEAAAILGRSFAQSLLQQMMAEAHDLAPLVRQLEARNFIYRERVRPEVTYAFRHVLARVAIETSLTESRRASLHLQAAQSIERCYATQLDRWVPQLAHHYAASDDARKAAHYLEEAGVNARRTFANQAAIIYFRQALEKWDQCQAQAPQSRLFAARGRIWNHLGRVYYADGQYKAAEEAFRQALNNARLANAPVHQQVRILYWLGEALYWLDKDAELGETARRGLDLLAGEAPCMEEALMLGHLTVSLWEAGDAAGFYAGVERLIPLVERFPFVEELSPAYHHVIYFLTEHKKIEEALAWTGILQAKAEENEDLTTLSKALFIRSELLAAGGDHVGALSLSRQALTLSRRAGESTIQLYAAYRLALDALAIGALEDARTYAHTVLEILPPSKALPLARYELAGSVLVGAGRVDEAMALIDEILAEERVAATPHQLLWLAHGLVAADRHEEARACLETLLTTYDPDTLAPARYFNAVPAFTGALALLDLLVDEPAAYQRLCRQLQAAASVPDSRSLAWYPIQTSPHLFAAATEIPSALEQWGWQDPAGDSSRQFTAAGFEITAADGRDLWYLNFTAPSLRIEVSGDAAIQVRMLPATLRQVTAGGLLLWQDRQNFARLDWGALAPGEVSFLGAVGNRNQSWGRGRTQADSLLLRLERIGKQIRALFSEDGVHWWLVGEVCLPQAATYTVGLMALGAVERMRYIGLPPGGAAARFDQIQLWQSPAACGAMITMAAGQQPDL